MSGRHPGSRDDNQPAAWLYWPLVALSFLAYHLLLGLRIRRDPRLRNLRGPLVVLGNHPSYLDPPILALACGPRRVHFLTTQGFFRKPLPRWLLHQLKAIPKVQFRTDMQATRQMFKVIHGGGVLAIYPEGQRSLDGGRCAVDGAIAKLVKKTGCPVAIVRERGAYLAWPRWSTSGLRPGRVEATIRLLLSADDLAVLTVPEIQAHIESALQFNDYGWQRRYRHVYLSLAPARGLHNLCHQCPACGRQLAMTSSRNRLTCRYCGNQAILGRHGFLTPDLRGMTRDCRPRVKSDPHRWHQWQLQDIRRKMNESGFSLKFPARADRLGENGSVKPAGRGTLRLTSDSLHFRGESSGDPADEPLRISLPYAKKTGLSFDFGRCFEIALGEQSYRFTPEPPQAVILIIDAILAAGGAGAT